jgi:hypothetical protein
MLNFVAAVGIGVVLGVIGGFALRGKNPSALWLAPVLATAGTLVAAVAALLFGDRNDYGWKEMSLQVVLALGGVVLTFMLSSRDSAVKAGSSS